MSRNIAGGFKPSTVSLGGATKRELTRDELLAQASAERESRAQIKARTRAATRIQVLWRGHFTRVREASSLVAAWKEKHARLAANPALEVTAASISGLVFMHGSCICEVDVRSAATSSFIRCVGDAVA
jgi:hypothetical protein